MTVATGYSAMARSRSGRRPGGHKEADPLDRHEKWTTIGLRRAGQLAAVVRYSGMDLVTSRRPTDTIAPREEPTLAPVQPAKAALRWEVERIYALHYRDVFRYLLALTRSVGDAEEITSETFERALKTWDRIPDQPLPWLLLTARRIATDRWRRVRRRALAVFGLGEGKGGDAGEARTEFWLWFDAVAAILTERQREAVVLRYQEDLTDAEIGTIMGISESGVRSLVARALAAMRSHPEVLS